MKAVQVFMPWGWLKDFDLAILPEEKSKTSPVYLGTRKEEVVAALKAVLPQIVRVDGDESACILLRVNGVTRNELVDYLAAVLDDFSYTHFD